MQRLSQLDLARDESAARYTKDEIVDVIFADCEGELLSREGPNRYRKGDAIITGSTGDHWSVSRDRFDAKYVLAEAGAARQSHRYRARPVCVWAKQMGSQFTIARCAGGDVLTGQPEDWVLQYAPGDYGVVENARFQRVYRRV
jgi:hypothetical protein